MVISSDVPSYLREKFLVSVRVTVVSDTVSFSNLRLFLIREFWRRRQVGRAGITGYETEVPKVDCTTKWGGPATGKCQNEAVGRVFSLSSY